MKKIKIFLFVLICLISKSYAQEAVMLSEITALPNTDANYIELYNASESAADISGYSIASYVTINKIYVFPTGTTIGAKSFLLILWNQNPTDVYPFAPENPNVIFINSSLTLQSGMTFYFLNPQNIIMDITNKSSFNRTSAILDETANLISGSGTYVTSFTPDPLAGTINIKRKSALLYGYNASGNRIYREMNTVYITNPQQAKSYIESDSIVEEQIANVSIESFDKHQITIYPNPTKGNLKVGITGEGTVDYAYKLYNVSGELLLNGEITATGEYPITMETYRSGIYILILEKGNEKETFKIIKE